MMWLRGQKPGLTECYSRPKATVQVRSWAGEEENGRAVLVGVTSRLQSCAANGAALLSAESTQLGTAFLAKILAVVDTTNS